MTTIETKPISEINFPTVTVCPPKGTFTNLNHDLVTINNTQLGEDQIQSLKSFIHKAIIDQEFEAVIDEDKSYKIRGKYESWFKGITKFTLPSTKTKTTFFMWTTASEGEAGTPNFEVDYSKGSFPQELSYVLVIMPPKNFSKTNDKRFHLEIHADTKKSEGENLELINISPNLGISPTSEMIKLSGPVVKNNSYPVAQRTSKFTQQILISYKRSFTDKDLKGWNEKRNTGFRAKWYYTDIDGNKLDVEADDIQSVPNNVLFVQFVKIYHVMLTKGLTKERLVEIVKNEKFILTENHGSAVKGKCSNGVLLDNEVKQILQNIAKKHEVTEEETNSTNFSSDDINEAGQLFVFLASCPKVYWIAWSEFFDNLLENYNLKIILLNLFRIRIKAKALEMERELNVSSSLLLEITNRFQLQQNNIARIFKGTFDSELVSTLGKPLFEDML